MEQRLEILEDLHDSSSEGRMQLFGEDIHQHYQDQQRLEKTPRKLGGLSKWMIPVFLRYTNLVKYQVAIVKS